MSKRYLRLIVDAAMFGLMLALLSYPLTRGLLPHGVMGMAFTGLVLFHHGLNLAWYKSLFRGRWTGERVLVTITDTGLLFATIALVASSLVMAGEVFSFAPFAMPWWGRGLHMGATAWIYALSCVHLGLHIARPVSFLQRHLGRAFWPMACALMLPSMYAFWLSGIWTNLLLWGAPSRPHGDPALFILQYLGAGLALCLPAHALMRLVRKKASASA